MSRILLTIFAVVLTLTALGCERRTAAARRGGVRHIVAIATADHALGAATARRSCDGTHDRAGSPATPPAATRIAIRASGRARGQSPWLSSDVEDDDDGSGTSVEGELDPTAPPGASPALERPSGSHLTAPLDPLASVVGPSSGHVRTSDPPPRA